MIVVDFPVLIIYTASYCSYQFNHKLPIEEPYISEQFGAEWFKRGLQLGSVLQIISCTMIIKDYLSVLFYDSNIMIM